MRSAVVRAVLAAAVMTGLIAGCGESAKDDGRQPASASKKSPAESKAPVAEHAGTIGGRSSPCRLPVTFGIAAKWKPEEVDIVPGDELAELAQQGPVVSRCEIDAKPAGNIGFIRVHLEMPIAHAAPRKVLEEYVAADEEPGKATYTEFTAGPLEATEVVYTTTSKLLEETRPRHAFAVRTPAGTVVVSLGGIDAEEVKGMLPAYELAKRTVRLAQ